MEMVRALLAIQAQDFDSARLALRARIPGLACDEVDRALADRQIVISWLCRGTLHLVCAEDLGWLLSLTAPRQLTGVRRRLAQEGVTPDGADRALRVIERALADRGPLTREELRPLVTAASIRSEGQAMVHLLVLAALRGRIVRCDRERFVLAADWLPRPPRVEHDAALHELGVRYRRAHAQASPHDLAWWAGTSVTDARRAWAQSAEPETEPAPLAPKLLASFDEYIMGWKERTFAVSEQMRPQVFVGGIIRGVAIDDGKVLDTWTKPAGRVRLAAGPRALFDEEARDVERFLAGR